jgi:hypothetical protein
MDSNTIKEVEVELERFNKRLKALKERVKDDEFAWYGCKETGAVKRSAMDLKMVLTKITQ